MASRSFSFKKQIIKFIFDCQSFPLRSLTFHHLSDSQNANVIFCKERSVGMGQMYFMYHRLTPQGPMALLENWPVSINTRESLRQEVCGTWLELNDHDINR